MSKERGRRVPPPPEPKESEAESYSRAVRYPDEQSSAQPYKEAQQFIYEHGDLALSVYRLQLNLRRLDELDWHVAVVGEQTSADIDAHFRRLLADGEDVTLPPEVLEALLERRREARKLGSWVEGHYRPGKRRRL